MKQHYFRFADGRQLSWYEAGSGPPLVFLHGWSISAAAFAEIAELLAVDYRLLIPDLPGHGDSSPAHQNDLAGLSADLVAWLQAINPGPVFLAGWSLGGMLAMHIAGAGLLSLKSLVLIGTTPRFTNADDWAYGLPAAQVHVLARNLKRRFEPTLGEFFKLTLAGEVIDIERLRSIRNFAVRNSPLPDKNVAGELLAFLAVQDQRDVLVELDCPVLVMHGAADQVSPLAAGRFLAEQTGNGQLAVFDGVGHAPFWSQPRIFVKVLREFLDGSR